MDQASTWVSGQQDAQQGRCDDATRLGNDHMILDHELDPRNRAECMGTAPQSTHMKFVAVAVRREA